MRKRESLLEENEAESRGRSRAGLKKERDADLEVKELHGLGDGDEVGSEGGRELGAAVNERSCGTSRTEEEDAASADVLQLNGERDRGSSDEVVTMSLIGHGSELLGWCGGVGRSDKTESSESVMG
ncbi:hypothetical protein M0R45_006804 [Rubus argutus]|uniref:Uncharacterized protein n=1 Tax=Rubus argutus TaxID=59490 RepID=A0AAW1YRW0_RUBAR